MCSQKVLLTLSKFHFVASQDVSVNRISVERIASFRGVTRRSHASPHQHIWRFQTRRANHQETMQGQSIHNLLSPVVDMSLVNCLIEHMLIILVLVQAEREDDKSLHMCTVENVLLFAPGHFAKFVRPTNHQSRVSATFPKSTLQNGNMESCWDALSNSWS